LACRKCDPGRPGRGEQVEGRILQRAASRARGIGTVRPGLVHPPIGLAQCRSEPRPEQGAQRGPGGKNGVGIDIAADVAGDVRLSDVDKPARPAIYYAARQSPNSMMTLAVKASEDPERLLPRIRESLKAIDPTIAIERPATLDAMLARSLEGRRLPMLFLGPFSLAALLLAAVGIYGVLAFAVRERTRELGIRLALGAQRRDVLRLVLGRAAALTACGLAAGAGAALLATRAMRSLLFGVEPADPVTLAVVAAGVAAMALLASWLPARRASRIDPNHALRSQ